MLTTFLSYALVTVFIAGGLWYTLMRVFFGESSRQAQKVKEKGRQFLFFLAIVFTAFYVIASALAR
jgi:Kef-type K+ transport system membrane component KefB